MHSPWQRIVKRVSDIVAASVALALLCLPMLVIALAIWREDGLPVFFRQERVGRGGRVFRIHKFRTMHHCADQQGPALTLGHDPRITAVGQWLRQRRLDELPQFIDVLLGDMSVIGPRPEVPRYVEHFPPELRERALAVRPGISDPSSLSFRNESELLAAAADPEREYIEVILPRKIALSVAYAERANLWTDLGVLWRTILVIFGR